jgi:hypothetical protein
MSSGGSNYSTGMTGGGNQVRIDSPASQQNGYGSAPAPGGKGGFPSAQNPYQQQPSVYMPPSQSSFYQQAFTQPRMEAPPRQYGLGGMGGGNAYARPFRSYGSPVEAPPPPSEMVYAMSPSEQPRYAVGPTPRMPGLMPDTYPTRRAPPVDGGQMNDMQLRLDASHLLRDPSQGEYSRQMPMPYPEERRYPVGPMPDMRMSNPEPVEATQGVVPEPNYSGGLGSLFGGGFGNNVARLPPSPSGFGPLQQQNPQLLAQMQGAEIEKQRKAADLQRLRSQPYDPRQLIG